MEYIQIILLIVFISSLIELLKNIKSSRPLPQKVNGFFRVENLSTHKS